MSDLPRGNLSNDDPHEFGAGIEITPQAKYWRDRSQVWMHRAIELGWVAEKQANHKTEFVSVKPVIVSDAPDAHQVWLDIGCQHFTVGEYQETKDEAEFMAIQLRIALGNIQPIVIKEMVNRFLGWRLPEDFGPDCGVSFTPLSHPNSWPIGTNLLTSDQAKAMFEYCTLKPTGDL